MMVVVPNVYKIFYKCEGRLHDILVTIPPDSFMSVAYARPWIRENITGAEAVSVEPLMAFTWMAK